MAEDRGPELAAVLGLFLGLTWLFVLLRVYVKTFLSKSWGADDYLIVVSLIFFSTYAASSLSGVKYGTGRHVQNIPLEDIPRALYFWWLCELFYTITTVFIRLSIAVFLLRICVKPIHKYIIYGTLSMVIAFSTFYFFLVLFQCSPVSFFWGQYEGMKGSCINPADVPDASIAHSAVSFTADWILGLLPIALIYNLKMNARTKISVAGLLSLGLLAGVATMIRVPYIKVLALTDDFLFATTDVAIWSTVEPGLGIVAAAGATLRPLFKSFYNLTSRGGTHQSRGTHPSKWGNSRAGYMQNNNDITPHSHKKSNASSDDPESIQLRTDVIHPGGVVTSVRSPFGDSNENMAQERGSAKHGGIKVHRTVEISRANDSDGSSIGSEPSTPWPRPGTARSDKDMV